MTDRLHRYEHLLGFALEHPWAATPATCTIIADILARRLAGESADQETITAALVAKSNRVTAPQGNPHAQHAIAVIPVYGVIAPRMNMLSEMSGGTTNETLTAQLRAAKAGPPLARIGIQDD